MKDLTSVSKQEQEKFLNSFDRIISDVDGVLLWKLHEKVPGSDEAVQHLRKLGKKISFLSNNSTKPFKFFFEQLQSMGFAVDEREIIVPAEAIIDYLKKNNVTKKVYVIGMVAIRNELENAGFKLVEESPDRIDETVPVLLQHVRDDENVGAVVVDVDINVNYVKLQKAVSYLMRPEVVFISGATDCKVAVDSKRVLMGPGYFLHPIEDVTGRKAHALAKPSPELKNFVVERLNIDDPSRVLFIGDSIAEDMAFASTCGFKKLLVFSGLANVESVEKWSHPEDFKPDYFLNSLKDLHDVINNVYGNKL